MSNATIRRHNVHRDWWYDADTVCWRNDDQTACVARDYTGKTPWGAWHTSAYVAKPDSQHATLAEAIASRLTPAQKRALLWLYDAPERVSFDDRLSLLYRDRWDLVDAPFGWAVNNEPWQYSPLGARVRAVLLAEAASDE